jgi:GT2 family glycosyltransferase
MEISDKIVSKNPELSIAVISWNCRDDVKRLLDSLQLALMDISHEIIFIDNASEDDTVEMIRSEYPYVKLTVNAQNNGVAKARNQALKLCSGRFVFIVDADCIFREGNIKDAITYLDENPNVGLLGFKLFYPTGELQDTGRTLPTKRHLILNRMDGSEIVKSTQTFRHHRMRHFDSTKLREAGFVSGAAQFFRRELLGEIGYLDETMFYGYEDSDFCARVIKSGRKVVYFPYVVFTHNYTRLTKKKPLSRLTMHQIRSFRIFTKKHGDVISKVNRNLLTKNDPPEFEVENRPHPLPPLLKS